MNLLAILFALGALRALERTPAITHDLSASYVRVVRGWIAGDAFWSAAWAPWLLCAIPVVALALLDARLPPLIHLVVSALVLWLCLGPRELAADLRAWLSASSRGDEAEAQEVARRLWDKEQGHQLGDMFIASHERLFGVLLWFFALGPAGALLYRLGRRLPRRWPTDPQHAHVLHAVLAFVPARITTVIFAAAGSADDVLAEWRRWRSAAAGGWMARTWAWLGELAPASLNVEEEDGGPAAPASLQDSVREFLELQMRALLILLALFAIFTVGNLFG